jgi:integrase/recombinase XerD
VNSNKNIVVENYLEFLLSERGLSKNSVFSYVHDLNSLAAFAEKSKKDMMKLDKNDLELYIASNEIARLKPSSVARRISTLKSFYQFLFSEKMVQENPAHYLEHPKKSQNLPKSLSLVDLDKLIAILKEDQSEDGIRNYCIVAILYSTGMRISELLALTMSQIANPVQKYEDYQVILIKGKGSKERVVILNQEALSALANYLTYRNYFAKNKETPFLFPSFSKSGKPTHLTRQMFFIALKKAAIHANLDPANVSPHKIRHSFASHILANGANLRVVQELLGHSDISSTQIYTKVLSSQARNLVKKHHPLSKKSA